MSTRPSWVGAAWAVFRKELRASFTSPVAWVFLAGFLALAGLFFTLGLSLTGEASLRPALPNLGAALLFVLPMLTMRLLAQEERAGTLELLLTAPVPLSAMILGKWGAALALCGVLLLCTAPLPAVLLVYGDPDLGVLLTSYLGLLACCAAFTAAGLFTSSLTREPMVAGVTGVLVLTPLWLAGAALERADPGWEPWLERLSLTHHLRSFATGVLDTGDVAWFVGVTAAFLFLTWRSLESRRWR